MAVFPEKLARAVLLGCVACPPVSPRKHEPATASFHGAVQAGSCQQSSTQPNEGRTSAALNPTLGLKLTDGKT